MSKNCLITGVNGFIGTATAKSFIKNGWNVIGLVKDRNNKTQKDVQERCSIVYGDIRDIEVLRYILSKYEIDYVLHLAAQPIVRICNNDPFTAYMTNVMGTLNLLEAARCLKKFPEKIIVMSSDKAYGPHEKLPYKEDSELVVADSYCTSKSCQDMISRSYAKTYGLPVVIVRAGNIYGPGDLNTSRLIPRSILRMLSGKNPVLYSGVTNFVREFIYIDNIISAYTTLLEKGVSGEAYNVGGTEPKKIIDVIGMVRDKINPDITIDIIDKDFYEIEAQYLDASKLMSLGWAPKVTLSEGLGRSIEWYSKYLNNGGLSCP